VVPAFAATFPIPVPEPVRLLHQYFPDTDKNLSRYFVAFVQPECFALAALIDTEMEWSENVYDFSRP
jgi:hypothetical protein